MFQGSVGMCLDITILFPYLYGFWTGSGMGIVWLRGPQVLEVSLKIPPILIELPPQRSHEKKTSSFPLNPGWLKAGALYWFIIIPIYLGSIIPYIPFGKLTWQWKIPIFNRKYIFKGSIFRCYVSLPEGNPTNQDCFQSLN